MNRYRVFAKKVRGGWVGVCQFGMRARPVLSGGEEPEIFQSQAEAVAVAGMVLTLEVAANA